MLMGVSENKVAINTRDILEKGLTLIGLPVVFTGSFCRAVAMNCAMRLAHRSSPYSLNMRASSSSDQSFTTS